MKFYSLEVIFEADKSKGQIWQYHNLDENQIYEVYVSLTIRNVTESSIFVIDNRNPSSRISHDEFAFNGS